MNSSGRFGWREWLLITGFALSLAVTGVFLARSLHAASTLRQEPPIRPWMTIPYVAHAYHVSRPALYAALGLPDRPRDRRPLTEIAREQGRPVADVIADLQRAVATAPPASPGPTRPRSVP